MNCLPVKDKWIELNRISQEQLSQIETLKADNKKNKQEIKLKEAQIEKIEALYKS